MSADVMWAIRKSSAVQIGVRQAEELGLKMERGRSYSNEGGRRRIGGEANETRVWRARG